LVVSKRTGNDVEWKLRREDESETISLEEVLKRLA
jgi:hypothetical protein